MTDVEGSYTIIQLRGCKIAIRSPASRWFGDDRAALFQVLIAGEYDELLESIKPGDRILDAGANIGCFTVPAAIASGPKGLVVAVEPDVENLEVLATNVVLNRLANVRIEESALSNTSCKPVQFKPGGVTGKVVRSGGFFVQSVTLAALLKRYRVDQFDVIKIDIEGAELELLDPPESKEVLGKTRLTALEVHSLEAQQRYMALFKESGYITSGPRTESDFLSRVVLRALGHPALVARLYRASALSVCSRVLGGRLSSNYYSNGQDYRAGVLLAEKC